MSSAAEEIDNTSRPKILRKKIGRKTTLNGSNLAKELAAVVLAGTGTSGTPGGNRPVLITDQFQLLTKLEGSAVGAWSQK